MGNSNSKKKAKKQKEDKENQAKAHKKDEPCCSPKDAPCSPAQPPNAGECKTSAPCVPTETQKTDECKVDAPCASVEAPKIEECRVDAPCDDSGERYQQQLSMLSAVNEYRMKHGVSTVALNDSLLEKAQCWASCLAKNDNLQNCADTDGAGECVAKLAGDQQDAEAVVKVWYDEIASYDFSDPPTDGTAAKNLIQMLWKSSTDFGCGIARSESGVTYAVGRFLPAANLASAEEIETNVLPAE